MPEPILVSIAAALAGKAATGLYDLVRRRFAHDEQALAELEAATDSPGEPRFVHAVAERIAQAEEDDPEFRRELRAHWEAVSGGQAAGDGSVANHVSGTVSGRVVQAGEIHGDVRLG
ncbi:hypothetical protein B0I33_11493 [Prauserella shujinwangii]|uniref:Uncharacterized protein n=1 Tax=Prauserella shujinwangii TaxID=1453103 RepID=A0A2T0LL52_9PSEU|nr:hypothetical protein [Prauserella shujinwangii]PRX43632.1 hypothetical protein B0I33_11493 [Prauserella shujinwangii]